MASPAEHFTPAESKRRVPGWHTTILVVVILGFSGLSFLTTRLPQRVGTGAGAAGHTGATIGTYLATALFEWLIFAYTFWGDHRYLGARIRDRVGGRWSTAGDVGRDAVIAIALWLALAALSALATFLHPAGTKVIERLLPRTPMDLVAWGLLTVSAGFCEEYVFRGYLQQQFGAFTGSIRSAIVLQAVVFGLAHGYQGAILMAVIVLYGLGFGAVAQWRGSLRPGMLGHAWIDFFSGLAGFVEHALHRI